MHKLVIGSLVILAAAGTLAGELNEFYWRESFETVEPWVPKPSWLGNPSPTATVSTDGKVACFEVDEPGHGMKWAAPMPAIELVESPYLVVRYRAENLDTANTDYLVFLDDRGKQPLHAVRPSDLVADGRWHEIAVDVTALTRAESVHTVSVQVQANPQGQARLWLDSLVSTDMPPEDAKIIRRADRGEPKPDWIAPLTEAPWQRHRDWLANPAADAHHRVEHVGKLTRFRVGQPGQGMKWSWDLAEPVTLEGHRWVSMRYRTKSTRSHADYAVAVMGKVIDGGFDYRAIISGGDLVRDGRWHTVNLDIRRLSAQLPLAEAIAVQVQAASADAVLEVAALRLLDTRQPAKLADVLDIQRKPTSAEFRTISVDSAANSRSRSWCRRLQLAAWFDKSAMTVEGIPFAFRSQQPDLAATPMLAKSQLSFPADTAAAEVYLLMLAKFVGSEEPAYGSGKFRTIRDVDRFRLRLAYEDGTVDECLPMNVASGQFAIAEGPQVLVAAADESKKLTAVELCDRTKQGAFAVAAVTARTGQGRGFPEALEESPPWRIIPPVAEVPASASDETGLVNRRLEARLSPEGRPILEQLIHRPTRFPYLSKPCPLVKLHVEGSPIPIEAIEPIAESEQAFDWYRIRGHEGLRLGLDVDVYGENSLAIRATVANDGPRPRKVALVAPTVGPYRLGEGAEDAFYLFPKWGAALDNRPCSYRQRYSGRFPVQFVDTFNAAEGRGLVLRTEDTDCLRKNYLLEKQDGLLSIGVEYPVQTLEPGQRLTTARTVLTVTDGDWHHGFEAYRRWVRTWYRPLSPRKPWFRQVFNFRQRFLWGLDPLYDPQQGSIDLQRAVDEARREFGGIDYLHLFDWGNCGQDGRIYGRTGDYSPYDYLKGGRKALRQAIVGVKAQGVPVGLYIEGYLLQESGRLGKKYGPQWQLIGPDGKGKYWPSSSEMFVCPGVAAWREVQASTYAAKVEELDVDGMYIDQFGFAGQTKDCYSTEHGHPVPSHCVVTERDCTRIIRRRIEKVKPGVATYTEEMPVDVTSQYQDGSFTYNMLRASYTQTRVPLNLARFALPDFKTIEILFCDKPTGSWATGVRWVFFNGEAIWLEGPAKEWFEPQTRETIRRCYRILRKHRDAFTSPRPIPLVPTEMGGLFANAFVAADRTVYTLYNSRHRTVRGPVLRVPHTEGISCYDEWHQRSASVERDGQDTLICLQLGPMGVGCVVVKPE